MTLNSPKLNDLFGDTDDSPGNSLLCRCRNNSSEKRSWSSGCAMSCMLSARICHWTYVST